jgi:hypothetical protein
MIPSTVLDGPAAPSQLIEIVRVDGCLDGCSTVRRMGCKPLKSLPRRCSTHLSRGTPYTPIEPERARAKGSHLGSRRQNVAPAATETAFRPASATGAAWDLKSPGATPVTPSFPLQGPNRPLARRGDDGG